MRRKVRITLNMTLRSLIWWQWCSQCLSDRSYEILQTSYQTTGDMMNLTPLCVCLLGAHTFRALFCVWGHTIKNKYSPFTWGIWQSNKSVSVSFCCRNKQSQILSDLKYKTFILGHVTWWCWPAPSFLGSAGLWASIWDLIPDPRLKKHPAGRPCCSHGRGQMFKKGQKSTRII